MKGKTNKWTLVIYASILVLFALYIWKDLPFKMSDANRENLETVVIEEDSPLFEKRLHGQILLTPFINKLMIRDNSFVINPVQDTLRIIHAKSKKDDFEKILLNGLSLEEYKEKTSRLSSLTPPIESDSTIAFIAPMDSINDTVYIRIPYEVMFSVFREEDNDENSDFAQIPGNTITPIPITITNPEYVNNVINNSDSKLILIGGPVWYHTSKVLSVPGNQNQSQINQMCALWNHARTNWNYIHDPVQESGRDTWRSSYETVSTYNATGAKKFTGDCDDFAILCAALARQIGYKSRFVASYNSKDEGHAYAEFFVPKKQANTSIKSIKNYFKVNSKIYSIAISEGIWIPMDWFGNDSSVYLGQKPFEGDRTEYTNL